MTVPSLLQPPRVLKSRSKVFLLANHVEPSTFVLGLLVDTSQHSSDIGTAYKLKACDDITMISLTSTARTATS